MFRPSVLGANRYGPENRQLDLKPDTYRVGNLSKVMVGSFRDDHLDNYGQTTFDYDPQVTTEIFKDIANDGALHDPTFTWRDFNGSGTVNAKVMGIDPTSGAPIMRWGSGPNPNKRTYASLFNRGTFYKDYKTDQTMAGWDTQTMTGLSYDIVLDTTESPDARRENAYKEHLRANNRMQTSRKKGLESQTTSDDNRTTILQRPYSASGAHQQQIEQHTKFAPGGVAHLAKQGMWHDVRQRSVDAMKKLRVGGQDMEVPYERAGSGGQVIDNGTRQVGTFAEEQRRAKVDHMERDWQDAKLGEAGRVHHRAWQADWQSNQEVQSDSKVVDNLLNRINTNMTLSQPAPAYFQYDYKRLEEINSTRPMMTQWARDYIERDVVKSDVDGDQELMIQQRFMLQNDSGALPYGTHISDEHAIDERKAAALLVGHAPDPYSLAYDATSSDKFKLYERLERSMPGINAPEFVTQSGQALNDMMATEARKTAARGAAPSALEAGSQRTIGDSDAKIYESRMVVNSAAQLARAAPKAAGRALADSASVGSDRAAMDTRLERTPMAQNAKSADSLQWRAEGAEANNNPARETRGRAMSYAPTMATRGQMAGVTHTDLSGNQSNLGEAPRRGR
jgi:hypothetical protein